MGQLHKKFTDEQIKDLLARYLEDKVKRVYIQETPGIKRRRFCQLMDKYRKNPAGFSIRYIKEHKTRGIDKTTESNILKELCVEKSLILYKDVPIHRYNYSYIKDRLEKEYKQKVALSIIIS